MADTNIIPGNLIVQGTLTCNGANLPASCVSDKQVVGGISASKIQHQHQRIYSQVNGSAATNERRAIHAAYGATGTAIQARAKLLVAHSGGGTPTVTVDILKNGTTILSAPISIVTADGTNWKTGAITVSSYVAGDVFEVNVVATAGGGTLGQGLVVEFDVREDAQ